MLIALAGGALLVQWAYFFLIYLRVWLHRYPDPDPENEATPVSVVIAARNEHQHLQTLIPLLYEQDHPDFEVVVVNDRSWDGTAELLKALCHEYPDLHVVTIDENRFNARSGKKFALTLGIKGAREDHVVFTDADCHPVSASWLRHLSSAFSNDFDLVIGYSPEKGGKGLAGFLSIIDSAYTGMQYLGFALAGVPYMGVGRNMGYSSELFYEIGGFKNHYSLPSGDDDLFVNQASRITKPYVVLHPDSHVVTKSADGLVQWWNRKRRHFTTSSRYRVIHKLLLITYPITALSWLLSSLLLMLQTNTFWFGIGSLGLRLLPQIVIFCGVFNRLGAGYRGLVMPFLEPIWYLLSTMVHVANSIKKPKDWK